MNWESIQGNWQHYKILARVRWGRISEAEFDLIGGRREVLAGQIEEVYGVTKDAAQLQIESWRGQQDEPERGAA